MKLNNKAMLDHFQRRLVDNFNFFCHIHDLDSCDPKQFVTYLIDHNIITPTTIRRYTILKEFRQMSGGKSEMVRSISSRFNISERSVYSILKEYRNKFDVNV